ncbi:hypothetical protein BOX15_Mlig030857g3, partial [Macrostomum lignano]
VFTMKGSFKPGDLVFSIEPYAVVVNSGHRLTRCDHCLSEGERKCSACKAIVYCSRDCQKVAWRLHHKLECRCLSNHRPNVPSESGRMFLKLLFRSVGSIGIGDDHEGAVWRDSAGLRLFKDLMSHVDELRADEARMLAFGQLCQSIRVFTACVINADSFPSSDSLLELFGRMVINAFSVPDSFGVQIGTAVCLSASVLDHRCQPNVHAYFQSGKLLVKCLTNVNRFDQLRINYCSLMYTWKQRRETLLSQYYFECNCSLCSDYLMQNSSEPDELKCSKTACQGVCTAVVDDSSQAVTGHSVCDLCTSQPASLDPSLIRSWRNRLQLELANKSDTSNNSDSNVVNRRKALLSNQENPLHPQHKLCAQLYDSLYSNCLSKSDWTEAQKIGEEILLPARKRHLGSLLWQQHDSGLLLYELGRLANNRMQLRQALGRFEQAESIFNLTVESDAPALLSLRYQIIKTRSEILAVEQSG